MSGALDVASASLVLHGDPFEQIAGALLILEARRQAKRRRRRRLVMVAAIAACINARRSGPSSYIRYEPRRGRVGVLIVDGAAADRF